MDDNGKVFVFFLLGIAFGLSFCMFLLNVWPPHTYYTINDKTYLVTQSNRKFIETDSIEITYNDKGVLVIKEKK